MERIQGLKEYVQTEHYLEGIGIGKEEQKELFNKNKLVQLLKHYQSLVCFTTITSN